MMTEEFGDDCGIIQNLKRRRSLLSVKELAVIFAMRDKALYRMIRRSTIPYMRFGYTIRFDPQAISQWMEEELSVGKVRTNRSRR